MWITPSKKYRLLPLVEVDRVPGEWMGEGRVDSSLWQKCIAHLESELTPQQFNTWIRPLQAVQEGDTLRLLAPNRFVLDWVHDRFLAHISEIVCSVNRHREAQVTLEVGTAARAAALQVAENPGAAYNPLFIYGGVGLGKTHLMHAVCNVMLKRKPDAQVVYLHSERFVGDMVKALQHNAINEFKRYYRSVDALLIDDIQFFAGKERSQEEFFHTFNALLEGQQQIILTCDRYPKEVDGLEERLKSRFGWGLTVAIEPAELETRVAILMSKAVQMNTDLCPEVANNNTKRNRTKNREQEGALRRVVANARFTGRSITLDFAKEALKDLLALQDKLVTIENIQKTVAEYYKLRVTDLLSERRSRSIARPRQLAMALAKELTNHSLPEIGNAFGGRDHTTVLHACRKVNELRGLEIRINEDYGHLMRTLTT